MPIVKKKDGTEVEVPRTFLTKPYLMVIEEGSRPTYGLFRHIEQEVRDKKTGKTEREKVSPPIGPLQVFRSVEGDEQPDMVSSHPSTKEVLYLKEITTTDGRAVER